MHGRDERAGSEHRVENWEGKKLVIIPQVIDYPAQRCRTQTGTPKAMVIECVFF